MIIKSMSALDRARSLGIKSLRPPVIPPCRFNSEQYDLVKKLLMKKSAKEGNLVQADESFDVDDLAEIDDALDGYPKAVSKEVVTPMVEAMEPTEENEADGDFSKSDITRSASVMTQPSQSSKSPSIESIYRKPVDSRTCLKPKQRLEVEMSYTTGPDDFYVRTRELRDQFDAITTQLNEHYKLDCRRKPASADMVGGGEVCAIQSWKTLDWRRIVCIQVQHDRSSFELIDSGERFELQVEEMWRLKAIPKVGEMSGLLTASPACVHCRLVDQQRMPEHLWRNLCETDLKFAFTITVHQEGQVMEVKITGLDC